MSLFKRKPKCTHVYKDVEEIYLRHRYMYGAVNVYFAAKQVCILCGDIHYDQYERWETARYFESISATINRDSKKAQSELSK